MEKKYDTFTVSQLNRRVRQLVEAHLPLIWVEGEISNLSKPASGHCYFKLKDESARVSCVMFRTQATKSLVPPENGVKVLTRCRVSIYEGSGDFQLIIEHMEEAGLGALQRKFDELKARLLEQGMFDAKHKRALPFYPNRIGIITSPTGAAIQDILSVLKRRYPATRVTIYPSIVQGKTSQGISAAHELTERISIANRENNCDVLIISRGGGSIEDLWAFNEEILARAIYASQIPIISAVGHEVDFTIADFVADHRAATPSAAAEIVSPDSDALILGLGKKRQQLIQAVSRNLQAYSQRVDSLRLRVRNPADSLAYIKPQLENLELRLKQSAAIKLNYCNSSLERLDEKVARLHPSHQLRNLHDRTHLLGQKLKGAMLVALAHKRLRWENAARLLQAVSPLNTLQRGYAIVLDRQKKVVRHIADLAVGDHIATKLIDGVLSSTVHSITPEKENDL